MDKEPILQLKSISKSFGGVKALVDVDFELYPDEILGLVGDNGAGKSTLIKIISGALTPDSGEIYFEGKKVEFNSPKDAKEIGIETVYQDLALVDTLNVPNNLFLGREMVKEYLWGALRVLRNKEMDTKSSQILSDLGTQVINVKAEVDKLSGGQRQAIAIAKAICWGKKVVIMDEPTAALGVKESKHALDLIKRLKEKGISVIVITHNLQHVFYLADRIIVLRHGHRIGDRMLKLTTPDEIVSLITGASLVVA
ncbi:MAG: ATP-binding cassette domain-containing protein [Actinobacteria bacterium]|nr:ATP-binding cassette domain-containing protein [Actinomycetota bacterium]